MYTEKKNIMHLHSCFANIYLLFFGLACIASYCTPANPTSYAAIFGRSRCRRRRRCLSYLLFVIKWGQI